jgi:hypothetical protein
MEEKVNMLSPIFGKCCISFPSIEKLVCYLWGEKEVNLYS